MEIRRHFFNEDLTVFCKKASSFPDGVKDAFRHMHSLLEFKPERMQLGLSKYVEQEMHFWAGSSELVPGEFQTYNLEQILLPKGEYAYISVLGYMQNIEQIGEAFTFLKEELNHSDGVMGIEWYVSMEEVWCMMRI